MASRGRGAGRLAGVALLAALGLPGQGAALTFQVNIDSSALAGQPGKIAFDLTSPDPTESVANLTALTYDATLGSTETVGGQSTGGLFQNDPASGVVIQDFAIGTGSVHIPQFFTSLALNLTWGTQFAFTLSLPDSGAPGAIPDMFAIYLLDPATGLPLYATGDPLGTAALFAVSVDAAGACLFLPAVAQVPVTLSVMNEIGEPFNACIGGGIALGKSRIVFGKKPGRDSFGVAASFSTSVPIDPAAGAARLVLLQNGVQLLGADTTALKPNKSKKRYQGKGTGVKKLVLTTKDRVQWKLTANGAKLDLSPANTGGPVDLGLRFETATQASASGFSPAGSGTFNGSGTFHRKKKKLLFP